MKKSVLIAALGLFSLNTMAQDAPKEEGFVFTTVKKTRLRPSRTRTVPVRVGASPASVSWKASCCAWAKENTTFPRCSSYTTPW